MQRDRQSLLDIVDSITLIFEYVTDWEDFIQSIKDQDAVIRRLTIVGEATKRLSMEFREAHPHVPWKDMAGLRDVIVHDYDEIDLARLKPVIEIELAKVLQNLQQLLSHSPEDRPQ
jgi:uncharacterized protein with HEPN domain